MTEADVIQRIETEVNLIVAAESGKMPSTPVVVMEVLHRMSTLKTWKGMDEGRGRGKELRKLVEQVVKARGARSTKRHHSREDLGAAG